MKRYSPSLTRSVQVISVIILALVVFFGVTVWLGERSAYALPEYSPRTGEPCATCHVNPGGGGPRTLRGLLWSAYGRPEAVPQLPNVLLAPGVSDGAELYDVACAACHGSQGEGLFAMQLVGTGISKTATRSFILRGIPNAGMPGFEGQFSDEQIEALVEFAAGLANEEIQPLPEKFPLPPPQLKCSPISAEADCQGR